MAGMWLRLRSWLLFKLIGESTVVVNATIRGQLDIDGSRPNSLVSGCVITSQFGIEPTK